MWGGMFYLTTGLTSNHLLGELNFYLLILSVVMTAAAGNIINDYYDVQADLVNNPKRVVIGRIVSKHQAKRAYMILNIIALCLTIYLDLASQIFFFVFAITLLISLLWWYSAVLKKKFLIGNVVVALLVSSVIYLTLEFAQMNSPSIDLLIDNRLGIKKINLIYAFLLISFFQNLAREIAKDIEDIEGDKLIRATTIPMLIGRKKGMILLGVITLIFPLMLMLFCIQFLGIIDLKSITLILLAAAMNLVVGLSSIFFHHKTTIKFVKSTLKITMIFGISYLFLT